MEFIPDEALPPIRRFTNRVRIAGLIALSVVVYAACWASAALPFVGIFGFLLSLWIVAQPQLGVVLFLGMTGIAMGTGLLLLPTRRWSLVRRVRRETAAAAEHAPRSMELAHIVEGLSIAAGIRAPRIVILNESAPNAFVIGTNRRNTTLGVTTAMIDELSRPELEAIVAWQVTRIASRDVALMTWATALASDVVRELDVVGSNDWDNPFAWGRFGRFLTALPRWLAATYESYVLRRMAVLRDRNAVTYTRNPVALIAALEKLDVDCIDVACVSRVTAPLWIEVPQWPYLQHPHDQRIWASLELPRRVAALRESMGPA